LLKPFWLLQFLCKSHPFWWREFPALDTSSNMSYFLGDSSDSQPNGRARMVKIAAALIGGACLVLLGMTVLAPRLQGADTATNLIGAPTSLRANPMTGMGTLQALKNLPGPSPWKELGIAVYEDSLQSYQQCRLGRDVSAQANSKMAAVMRTMDKKDLNVLFNLGKKVAKKAKSPAVKKAAGSARGKANPTGQTVDKGPPVPFGLEAGVVNPVQGFWDPFGLSANVNEGQLLFFREAEIKHGRVCMLAALGFLVQEKFHPLFGGDIDIPSIQAFAQAPIALFWPVFIVAAGALEFPSFERFNYETEGLGFGAELQPGEAPGAIGFDPLNLKPSDPEELLKTQNQEILHGRLAMISAAGLIAQEILTQSKIGEGTFFEQIEAPEFQGKFR